MTNPLIFVEKKFRFFLVGNKRVSLCCVKSLEKKFLKCLERKEKTSTFASAFEKEARLKKPDKEAIFEEMRYNKQ
jgi:hypothetical protein